MPDQTLSLWIAGVLVTICAAAMGYLYKRLGEVEMQAGRSFSVQLDDFRKGVNAQLTDLNRQLEEIRNSRVRMAETMVTRPELDKQTDRLIAEIRDIKNQNRWSPS